MADRPSRIEGIVLAALALLTVLGMVLAASDAELFRIYTREDGVVENATVAGLLGGAAVCFRRLWRLRARRSRLFLAATALLGVLLVAAAGEELSWGQHFLGFKAPDFFQQHNAQREANVHNLVVQGVKINRLIFGTGLFVAVVAYCSLLPLGYRRWPTLRHLVDALAVPVPRTRHIAWYAALALLASLIPSKYRWEVVELVSATIFCLIIALPLNTATFTPDLKQSNPTKRASSP
jgi:hypothetical protein